MNCTISVISDFLFPLIDFSWVCALFSCVFVFYIIGSFDFFLSFSFLSFSFFFTLVKNVGFCGGKQPSLTVGPQQPSCWCNLAALPGHDHSEHPHQQPVCCESPTLAVSSTGFFLSAMEIPDTILRYFFPRSQRISTHVWANVSSAKVQGISL